MSEDSYGTITLKTCCTCGGPITGCEASASQLMTCDICHRPICHHCVSQSHIHHVGQTGFIRVCKACSKSLENKGNKPIDPYKFIGG